MNMPTATYRIQFNPAFGFQAAQPIISYLADLDNLSQLKRKRSEDNPDFIKLLGILYVLKSLSSSDCQGSR